MRPDVPVLTDLSLSVTQGQTVALVGTSGCGKSTLARLVTLIEKPTAGSLRIGDVEVATASAAQLKDLRRSVQIVFQDPYGSLNPRQKVGTIIQEPLTINTKLSGAERRERPNQPIAHLQVRHSPPQDERDEANVQP